jgi:alkyl hydroperoxide reductase subunit AhpC
VLIEEGENAGVALRGLFIIGPDGRLRQKTVNDLPVGRSGESRAVRAVRAGLPYGVQSTACSQAGGMSDGGRGP